MPRRNRRKPVLTPEEALIREGLMLEAELRAELFVITTLTR